MAFSLFSSKNRIINFVINDHCIRFLELKQAKPPIAQRWSERTFPPGIVSDGKIMDADSLANILEECMDEWKIHRRSIRFIVPDPLVIIRTISVPAEIQDDELRGYLYLELGSSIHLPFEEPVFDFYQLESNEKTKTLLLFAAPEEEVMKYVNLFEGVKLNPIAADISPLALYRLYDQLVQAPEGEVLFAIQMDLTSVNLSIFDGSVPLVMRQSPLPYNVEDWELKRDRSGLTTYVYKGNREELSFMLKELYREINKLLDYYKYSLNNANKDVTRFLLNGDHPMLKSMGDELKGRFDTPVTFLSLNKNSLEDSGNVPPNFFLSLGLALKEV